MKVTKRVARAACVGSVFCVLVLGACGREESPAAGRDKEVTLDVLSTPLTIADCPAGYHLIQGTSANNTLVGTAGNDCIFGLGGSDTIYGRGGDDFIVGGTGNDTLWGEAGSDRIYGEAGLDTISGGDGNDSLYGGDGVDSIHGDADRDLIHGDAAGDKLWGDSGDDILDGDANADVMAGGDGDDVLYGDGGDDQLSGEAGDDALLGGTGTNTLNGGPGTDACSGTACELAALSPSGCTATTQCAQGTQCIADFGLCMGCVTDQDADLTCDSKDGCPTDAAKSAPGVCGCGVSDADSDADGVANCVDGCAEDANKVAARVCGCGVSDADSDSDGSADCIDACPSDSAKQTPGQCGCGSSDADDDGDQVANCLDACAADPAKTAPGVCGCGTSEADLDADGIVDCVDECPPGAQGASCGLHGLCSAGGQCNEIACVAGATGPGVFSGNVTIDATNTAQDLALLAGKWCVTGNLTVTGTTLTDLTALAAVESVGATLSVSNNSQLQNLNGLHLRKAPGLVIHNNPLVTSLAPLSSIENTPYGIQVSGMSSLGSLDGLPSLGAMLGNLTISNNPLLSDLSALESLTSVASIITLLSLPSVTSIESLINLTSANGLRISSLPALTSLSGLDNLQRATDIELVVLGIQDFTGLGGLTTLSGSLNVHGCSALVSVQGLTSMSPSSLGSLRLINSQLASLEGLEWITSVRGDVYLGGPLLTSLAGLDNLHSVGGALVLMSLTGLQNVEALSGVTSVGGYLQVSNSPALTDLEGLRGLTAVGSWARLTSLGVTSLAGLRNVHSFGGFVEVSDNPFLDTLGLTSLTSALSVQFSNNPNLSHCEQIRPLAEQVSGPIYTTNTNSVEGCPLHTVELPLIGAADVTFDPNGNVMSSQLNPEFPEVSLVRDEFGNLVSTTRVVMEFDLAALDAVPLSVSGSLELHAESAVWGDFSTLTLDVVGYDGDGIVEESDANTYGASVGSLLLNDYEQQSTVSFTSPWLPTTSAWGLVVRVGNEWSVGTSQHARLYSVGAAEAVRPKLTISYY